MTARLTVRDGREEPLARDFVSGSSITVGLLAALALLAIIIIAVVIFRCHRKSSDGPPKYKPPPPAKTFYSEIPSISKPMLDYHDIHKTEEDKPTTNIPEYDDADLQKLPHFSWDMKYDPEEKEGVEEEWGDHSVSVNRESSFISSAIIV